MSHTHDCQMAVSMNLPLPDGSRKMVATAGAVPSTMTRAERRCGCWQATPSAAARLSAMAETLAAGATSWNESWLGLGLGLGLKFGLGFGLGLTSEWGLQLGLG